MHQLAEETQRRIREEADNQQSHHVTTHNTNQTKLEEQVASLRKTLQETTIANREEEQKLRKVCFLLMAADIMVSLQRAYKRETEVENWIQKYDHDVGGQQVCMCACVWAGQTVNVL